MAAAMILASTVWANRIGQDWTLAAAFGVAVAVTTLLIYGVLLFGWNLVTAHKRERRRQMQSTIASFPIKQYSHMRRDPDFMQCQAGRLIQEIDRAKVGVVRIDQAAEVARLIAYFGKSTAAFPWLSRSCQRRALAFHKKASVLTELADLRALCVEFVRRRPKH
ncbi:MAG TPA: hypothetical protein VNJ70_10925 [Thermoanaerobaculia bacterium]|nr:hypothetical protein [Thermoanaerobaculia bacterium]